MHFDCFSDVAFLGEYLQQLNRGPVVLTLKHSSGLAEVVVSLLSLDRG
jgi:hypothetical protein